MSRKENLSQLPGVKVDFLYGLLEKASAGYKQFRALKAALNIGLFDRMKIPKTIGQLCLEMNTHEGVTQSLCDLLVHMGLLDDTDGCVQNTAVSATYLVTDSPFFQGEVLKDIQNGFTIWDHLDQALAEGPLKVHELDFFQNNTIHSLAAEIRTGELQNTVAAVSKRPEFKEAEKLLDLGGGHGLYAMALCRENPGLQGVVFDFPNAAEDIKPYLEKFKPENVKFMPGNLFSDDWGQDYDIIFFSYNPGGKNRMIFEKINQSLKPGGLFVTKHAFYQKGEGGKAPLLDLEWNLTAFEGVSKDRHIYRFQGDLCFEDYLELMKQYFARIEIMEASDFADPPLAKFGDRLDSKIILAQKKDK